MLTIPLFDKDIALHDDSASRAGLRELLTADQLVKFLFSSSKASDRGHIVFAIEQLTKWSVENGVRPRHDSVLVAREVGDASIPAEQLQSIVALVRRTKFVYEWVHPQYQDRAAGLKRLQAQSLNEVFSEDNR